MHYLNPAKTLILGLAFALLPLGAFADEHYHTKEQHDAESQRFLTTINATPEQRKQFETHHKQYEEMVNPVRTELQQKKQALIEYLASAHPEKKEALRMQADVDRLQEKMNRFYIDHIFTKRSFVKPEQEASANAFYQQQVDKWKAHHQHEVSGHNHEDHHSH